MKNWLSCSTSGPEDFAFPDTAGCCRCSRSTTSGSIDRDPKIPPHEASNPPLLAAEPKIATQQLEDWDDLPVLLPALARVRDSARRPDAVAGSGGLARIAMLRRLAWLRAAVPRAAETAIVGAHRLDTGHLLGTRPFFYAERPSMADLAP
jgi:hypothetical protein